MCTPLRSLMRSLRAVSAIRDLLMRSIGSWKLWVERGGMVGEDSGCRICKRRIGLWILCIARALIYQGLFFTLGFLGGCRDSMIDGGCTECQPRGEHPTRSPFMHLRHQSVFETTCPVDYPHINNSQLKRTRQHTSATPPSSRRERATQAMEARSSSPL